MRVEVSHRSLIKLAAFMAFCKAGICHLKENLPGLWSISDDEVTSTRGRAGNGAETKSEGNQAGVRPGVADS